jgi:hypothetical protein
MDKVEKKIRDFNGIIIEQSLGNGFINGTAICLANQRNIFDWLKTDHAKNLVTTLAENLHIEPEVIVQNVSQNVEIINLYPSLFIVENGSSEDTENIWLHPDLAIQLAQWCSKSFAIQVSKWVREWLVVAKNPIYDQVALDRVVYRDILKDEARLRMTDQIKVYLEQTQRYDDKKYSGQLFAKVHDAINVAITTETSKQMRDRIFQLVGKQISHSELIGNYFPFSFLQRYISVFEAVANFMLREDLHPLIAVERAIEIVLPAHYVPQPIDFAEHIKNVHLEVAENLVDKRRESLYRNLADK